MDEPKRTTPYSAEELRQIAAIEEFSRDAQSALEMADTATLPDLLRHAEMTSPYVAAGVKWERNLHGVEEPKVIQEGRVKLTLALLLLEEKHKERFKERLLEQQPSLLQKAMEMAEKSNPHVHAILCALRATPEPRPSEKDLAGHVIIELLHRVEELLAERVKDKKYPDSVELHRSMEKDIERDLHSVPWGKIVALGTPRNSMDQPAPYAASSKSIEALRSTELTERDCKICGGEDPLCHHVLAYIPGPSKGIAGKIVATGTSRNSMDQFLHDSFYPCPECGLDPGTNDECEWCRKKKAE